MIKCMNLSKQYAKGSHSGVSSIKDLFSKPSARPLADDEFWALRNVSFDISAGDVVGLLGRNGAGKTTLLKILTRVTLPTEGRAEIAGRVGSMLGAASGFHPELTGYENIFFSGAILGLSRSAVAKELDRIIAFSGVGDFIHTPVKRYSSGMRSRLGFAISAHVLPEVLILDEVLSVGDLEFQEKALQRVEEISKAGQTIIYVSHQLEEVARICKKVLVLDKGKLLFNGHAREGIAFYENLTRHSKDEHAEHR